MPQWLVTLQVDGQSMEVTRVNRSYITASVPSYKTDTNNKYIVRVQADDSDEASNAAVQYLREELYSQSIGSVDGREVGIDSQPTGVEEDDDEKKP